MMLSLPAFSGQQCDSEAEVAETRRAVTALSLEAPKQWVQARVAALLSHYFVAATDLRIIEAMAEDWWRVLKGHPAWAVSNACVWWLGRENPKHDRKPLPGDIAEAVHRETERVRVADWIAQRGVRPPPQPIPPAEKFYSALSIPVEERREQVRRIMGEVFAESPLRGEA